MATIHSEKADIAWWILLLFRLLACGMVLLFAWMAWEGIEGWWGLAFASFLSVWAFLSFDAMRYELSAEEVTAWFWPFRTRIRLSAISRVEVKRRVPWWVGVGCHWWKNSWWYIGRPGSYLHVVQRDGKGLAMTPKEPERFAVLIRERFRGEGQTGETVLREELDGVTIKAARKAKKGR